MRGFERVESKLAEANFFLGKLEEAGFNHFEVGCYLSAFASAARSVTLALQAVMAGAPGFKEWYTPEAERLKANPEARWFLALRNTSIHEGGEGVVGASGGMTDGKVEVHYWSEPTC